MWALGYMRGARGHTVARVHITSFLRVELRYLEKGEKVIIGSRRGEHPRKEGHHQ